MRQSVSRRKPGLSSLLRRHLGRCVVIFLLVTGIGLAITFFFPPTHQASVRFRITSLIKEPSGQSGKPLPASSEEIRAQLQFLQSHQHLEAVAREFNLMADERNQPLPVERAIKRLSKGLTVSTDEKSGVITLQYRDRDAARPVPVVQAFYKNLDEQLKLTNAPAFATMPVSAGTVLPAASPGAAASSSAVAPVTAVAPTPQPVSLQQEQIARARDAVLQEFYLTQSQINAVRAEITENEKKIAGLQLKLSAASSSAATSGREEKKSEEKKPADEAQGAGAEKTESTPAGETVAAAQPSAEAAAETLSANAETRMALDEMVSARTAQMALRNREKSLTALAAQYQAKMTELDQMILGAGTPSVTPTPAAIAAGASPAAKPAKASSAPALPPAAPPAVPSVAQNPLMPTQPAASPARALVAELVEAVTMNQQFAGINWKTGSLLSVIGGLLAGLLAALIREKRDPLVSDAQMIRERLGVEVLGTISDSK